MLVSLARLSAATALAVLLPTFAVAAPRVADYAEALAAQPVTAEEIDRAFARPVTDASADPIVRVDESALRYYAAQHAQARVEAEIRRLRALYPGWEPPADLYRSASGGEDQALWDLYGRDRIDDLKLEIDRRMARQAGWRPSPEMIEKLRLKEMRLSLVSASDKGEWKAVLGFAEREPMLVDGRDLDVLWRVAEASAKTGATAHARDLYDLAMGAASSGDERLGTVRKAVAVLGSEAAAPLLAGERNGEFEPLRLDLARTRLGEWLKPEATGAVPEADLQRVTTAAKRSDAGADDALLLGWVELKRNAPAAALDWFRLASTHGAGAKATLGAVIAADRAGKAAEARDLAAAGAEDGEVGAMFVDLSIRDLTAAAPPPIGAERLGRIGAAIERLESGDGAQALGWYAFKARQYDAARAWFAKAMAWRPSAKTAEGHLLALKALGDRAGFDKARADWLGRFPELAAMPGWAEPTVKTAGAAKKSCSALVGEARRSAADDLSAGWCLMERDRGEEAIAAFDRAGRGDPRLVAEAGYGIAMAHLRAGRTQAAVAAAETAGLSTARRDEIGRIALSQQAIAAFNAENWRLVIDTLDRRRLHAAEPRDLAGLRGWALYHLGRKLEARAVFAEIDAQMSTHDSRTGLSVTVPAHFVR